MKWKKKIIRIISWAELFGWAIILYSGSTWLFCWQVWLEIHLRLLKVCWIIDDGLSMIDDCWRKAKMNGNIDWIWHLIVRHSSPVSPISPKHPPSSAGIGKHPTASTAISGESRSSSPHSSLPHSLPPNATPIYGTLIKWSWNMTHDSLMMLIWKYIWKKYYT